VRTIAIVIVVNSLPTQSRLRRAISFVTVVTAACLLGTVPTAALAGSLSEQDLYKIRQMVAAVTWVDSGRAANLGPDPHPLGRQTISIEPSVGKNKDRLGDVRVYQFDYELGLARVVTVSLKTDSIVNNQAIQSVHLPLNSTESEAALTLLGTYPDAIAQLQADQIRRGDAPVQSLSELSVKASVYTPMDTAHECTVERCALLSLFDHRNTVFALEPIINLQRGTLAWLDR